jgi:thiamine-monophosphate kinase
VKLRALGEFGLIEQIRQKVVDPASVYRGIGDDAAELSLPDGHRLLTSTDMLVEGVHFRFEWTDSHSLGRKAVAVNLSDLAAMGGTPSFLYLSLACPVDVDFTEVEAFFEGALAEMATFQVTLVGGDTCRSPGPWVISVTVEGHVSPGDSVGRLQARPGDVILVSGTLGDSALALNHLKSHLPVDPYLLQRHLRPLPRIALGQALGAQHLASAMIDISDGLSADLGHLLMPAGLDALLDAAHIPLSSAFRDVVRDQPDFFELALHGGEDYELLFTAKPENVPAVMALSDSLNVPVSAIGKLENGSGQIKLRQTTGRIDPVLARGYDHFGPSQKTPEGRNA